MNATTRQQLITMTDQQIVNLCHDFPYPSQWENQDAFDYCLHRIALMRGRRYHATGNIKAFKKL